MSLPGRTRAAALCAALSAVLIAGMAGTAIVFSEGCTLLDRGACVPAPVAALSTAPRTAMAPSPEPTPAVPAQRRCDSTEPDSCTDQRTYPVGALATGMSPTP